MRDRVLKIRLSSNELANLQDIAMARGLTMSDFCRRRMANIRLPRRAYDQRDRELLGRLLGALAKVGSNLNQITRAVNMGRQTANTEALTKTLRDIDELRNRLREMLS